MKSKMVALFVSGFYLFGCGDSGDEAEVNAAKDISTEENSVRHLGEGVFKVICKDGSTEITTAEKINSDDVCETDDGKKKRNSEKIIEQKKQAVKDQIEKWAQKAEQKTGHLKKEIDEAVARGSDKLTSATDELSSKTKELDEKLEFPGR